jgi:hypothetical protein
VFSHPLAPRVVARFALALAAVAAVSAVAAEEEWRLCSQKEGVTLEKRAVPHSSYYEYRARAHVAATPQHAFERIWNGVLGEQPPSVTKRVVVRHSDDEIVVYDQIHAVVVSDRDVTTRLQRKVDSRSGAYEIQFDTANELGPPPNGHYVRLPVVRGSWRVEPDPAGGSTVAYICYSEPGGSVPAFLVRGAQQDTTSKEFARVILRIDR